MEIIIPVYNEGENIIRTLEEIEGSIKHPHAVTVVYDFDQDDTLPPLRRFMAARSGTPDRTDIRALKNAYGRGALNAIRTGFESARLEWCLVCMGDLSDDMTAVAAMLAKAEEGCDVVCGSRYMAGGRQIGGPVFKGLLSRIAGVTLHRIAGIPTHDATNSFKLYRRSLFERIRIESRGGFEIGMEIVIKAHLLGCKIGEVPSTWRDRSGGASKFKLFAWLPHYLHWYFLAFRGRFQGAAARARAA
ncbi:MAG TPA: glycosyltransferase, partial [Fibrobacteria bacterium]|nr:glycosyltransferase [Fibrobacteria bacterium]